MRQICVPYLAEDAALRSVGYFSGCKRLALSRHGSCKRTIDTIEEGATTFAKALWQSIAKVQIMVWLPNFNKQHFGPNNFKPYKSPDTIALAALHTTKVPHFEGSPP